MNFGSRFGSLTIDENRRRESLLSHLNHLSESSDAYMYNFQATNNEKLVKDDIPSGYLRPNSCLLTPDTSFIGGTIPYEYIFPSQPTSTKRKAECIDEQEEKEKKRKSVVKKAKYGNNPNKVVTHEQTEPIDLSNKQTTSNINHIASNSVDQSNNPVSQLRGILCGTNSYNPTTNNIGLSRNTPVTLAKKNFYPVTSRVSSWLQDVVQFAKETPEFGILSSGDQISLLHSSWAQLVVLYMAENSFSFAVTAMLDKLNLITIETPTMSNVQKIEFFIKKCQSLSLSSEEYKFIRSSVLFSTALCSSPTKIQLENPTLIEGSHHMYLKKLEHCQRRINKHTLYPQLLMLFPSLYSINCKMMAHLFLCNISVNLDTFFSDQLCATSS